MSELRSHTVVLLLALPIWIYHPVCSCLVRALLLYTLMLYSALLIWIYHPVYRCSVRALCSYTFVSELCSYTLVLLLTLQFWIYDPVCSCLVSELCSYTLVLLSATSNSHHCKSRFTIQFVVKQLVGTSAVFLFVNQYLFIMDFLHFPNSFLGLWNCGLDNIS